MIEPARLFDYDLLDADTASYLRIHASRIHEFARATAIGIVQIGLHLTEAKNRVGHGKFLKWIEAEFAWTYKTAERFIGVYQRIKIDNLSNLAIDVSALYLIAAPRTAEPVRTEVIRRAEAGEPITHQAVVALRKQYQETGELPDSTTELIALVQDGKRRLEEAKQTFPSPAAARQIAIQTGKHTRDWNGTYQPPMSQSDEAQWNADRNVADGVRDFVAWSASAPAPNEIARTILKHHWTREFNEADLVAAIEWLYQFKEAFYGKAQIAR
jgi:hypothetical protein